MAKKRRPVRLYIDVVRDLYWSIVFTDAKHKIKVPVPVSVLKYAKRGYPWECWLAYAIVSYIQANPTLFPEAVAKIAKAHKTYVYVIRSAIYLISGYAKGQPSHAIRYFHDLGPLTKKFDRLPRSEFLKLVGDTDLTLTMRPAKRGGQREPEEGRRPSRNMHRNSVDGGTQTVSRGAFDRAKDAGIIPAGAESKKAA